MNVVRLVKKAKKGDKEALLQLVLAEKDDYYRLALTYMRNAHDAMDAVEDMIVTLYEKMTQLKKNTAFYSWSKTILVNECKKMLRTRQKVVHVEHSQMVHIAGTGIDPYRQREQQLDMNELLNHLNEQQREAIQLKYFHDLDYQTIAQIMNAPVGTIKSRVFQGLKKLQTLSGGERNEGH